MFEVDWDKTDKLRKEYANICLNLRTYSKMVIAVLQKEAFTKKGEPRVYRKKALENAINKAIKPAYVSIREDSYDITILLNMDCYTESIYLLQGKKHESTYDISDKLIDNNGKYNLDNWIKGVEKNTADYIREFEKIQNDCNKATEICDALNTIERIRLEQQNVSGEVIKTLFGGEAARLLLNQW